MESSENPAGSPSFSRIQFRHFTFDPSSRELWLNRSRIRLRRQPAIVLALLTSRPGEVVTRDDIRQALWGNETYIDFDQGINWCIREIRKALHDDPAKPAYIETISKQGYRFLAPCSLARQSFSSGTNKWPLSLQWRFVVSAILLLMLVAGTEAFRIGTKPATVLVLPLDNYSGDLHGDLLADARTDYLIASLGTNPRRLQVIDRLTAAKFKKTGECIIKIGQQLHADYVFVGSIDPSQTGLQLSAGLFRVADNKQVWAKAGIDPTKDQAIAEISSDIVTILR